MAIRPAAEADRDFILAELALLPRPPYREPVGLLLRTPAEHIWLDDERGLLCVHCGGAKLTAGRVIEYPFDWKTPGETVEVTE